MNLIIILNPQKKFQKTSNDIKNSPKIDKQTLNGNYCNIEFNTKILIIHKNRKSFCKIR